MPTGPSPSTRTRCPLGPRRRTRRRSPRASSLAMHRPTVAGQQPTCRPISDLRTRTSFGPGRLGRMASSTTPRRERGATGTAELDMRPVGQSSSAHGWDVGTPVAEFQRGREFARAGGILREAGLDRSSVVAGCRWLPRRGRPAVEGPAGVSPFGAWRSRTMGSPYRRHGRFRTKPPMHCALMPRNSPRRRELALRGSR